MNTRICLMAQTIVVPVVLLTIYIVWVVSLKLGIWGNVGMVCLWLFLISNYYMAVYLYNCLRNNKTAEILAESKTET